MKEINIYILLVCRRTDKFTLVPQPGYNPLKDGSNPTQKMQLILNCEKRFFVDIVEKKSRSKAILKSTEIIYIYISYVEKLFSPLNQQKTFIIGLFYSIFPIYTPFIPLFPSFFTPFLFFLLRLYIFPHGFFFRIPPPPGGIFRKIYFPGIC